MLTEHVIARWHGNGVTVRSMPDDMEETIPASALVMATTNVAFDPFPERIPGKAVYRIGDCVAPRQAPYAFHKGRKVALDIWGLHDVFRHPGRVLPQLIEMPDGKRWFSIARTVRRLAQPWGEPEA